MLDPKDWLPGLTVYSAFPAAFVTPAGTVLTKNGERFVIDDTRAWYDEWPECRTHLAPLAPVAAPTTKPLADGRWRDDYDVPAEPVLDDEDGPLEADECWRRYLRDPRSCDPCHACADVIDWAEAAFEEAERRVELKARMWRLGL